MGVPIVRARLFGVYRKVPDFWKLSFGELNLWDVQSGMRFDLRSSNCGMPHRPKKAFQLIHKMSFDWNFAVPKNKSLNTTQVEVPDLKTAKDCRPALVHHL